MLNNIFQPYHTMQEINLDWILTKVKNILRFVPDDGAVGQILRRTAHGAEWSNEQGGGGAVDSVNGQTGTVVLGKSDIGLGNVDNVQQYSASNPPPYPVTSVNGQTGAVTVSGGAVDSVNGQTGTVVLGKSDIGLGSVDNVQQYSASNPPPYPVTSVNGQTGSVALTASDVGAVATGYTTATATRVGTYIYSMELAKAGEVKVASYEIRTASTLIPASYTLVATLPTGYYPAIVTSQAFIDGQGRRAIIKLDTDGSVYIYNYSGDHLSSAWSIAYI